MHGTCRKCLHKFWYTPKLSCSFGLKKMERICFRFITVFRQVWLHMSGKSREISYGIKFGQKMAPNGLRENRKLHINMSAPSPKVKRYIGLLVNRSPPTPSRTALLQPPPKAPSAPLSQPNPHQPSHRQSTPNLPPDSNPHPINDECRVCMLALAIAPGRSNEIIALQLSFVLFVLGKHTHTHTPRIEGFSRSLPRHTPYSMNSLFSEFFK